MNTTNHENETLSYMIYMANRWSKFECIHIYGKDMGKHIWSKYEEYYDRCGMYGAISKLVYELDSTNLPKLLNRACELYNGRANRNK